MISGGILRKYSIANASKLGQWLVLGHVLEYETMQLRSRVLEPKRNFKTDGNRASESKEFLTFPRMRRSSLKMSVVHSFHWRSLHRRLASL